MKSAPATGAIQVRQSRRLACGESLNVAAIAAAMTATNTTRRRKPNRLRFCLSAALTTSWRSARGRPARLGY